MSPAATLSRVDLAAYGILGLPLAFAALPIYVHVPKLYGDGLGLSLSLVGAVLLGARLLDAFSDPLIGWWSDRIGQRRLLIGAALPLLAIGMLGLLRPAIAHPGGWWLAAMLAVVYAGFSCAQVNYYAWGAELARAAHERTRVTTWREAFTLLGIIAASALPSLLAKEMATGLARMAVLFVPLLLGAALLTLWRAPQPPAAPALRSGPVAALHITLRNRRFVWLLAVFAINGIASSIPATLVLFFVADVLRLEQYAGLFLAIYFVSGAAALPAWLALSQSMGKARAWFASMLLAILVFVWAFSLVEGQFVAYTLICALAGAALGADLALPPSMLADVMDSDVRAADEPKSGAYFGLWNLVTKLSLALAAGIALPLLGALGYHAGSREAAALSGLSAVYALLPVALKLGAAALLWSRFVVEQEQGELRC